MKVGLLARATTTGLGSQTLEIYRHLRPAVTVVVDTGRRSQTPTRADWYPDGRWIAWDERNELDGALSHLSECDVVVSCETFYSSTLSRRLAHLGVGTVLIVNPELWVDHPSHWATTYWSHTDWLSDRIPEARVVPMPCPTDRFEPTPLDQPLRIVHPTARAMADRNGTRLVRKLSRRWTRHGWIVDEVGPGAREVVDYWQRDPGAAVSVIPRRYGGLCLPTLEAFSAGVPVVMPDCPPNMAWPIVPVASKQAGTLLCKVGRIDVYDCAPSELDSTVIRLLSDRARLEEERERVRTWALEHSWDRLAEVWWEALEDARLTG